MKSAVSKMVIRRLKDVNVSGSETQSRTLTVRVEAQVAEHLGMVAEAMGMKPGTAAAQLLTAAVAEAHQLVRQGKPGVASTTGQD